MFTQKFEACLLIIQYLSVDEFKKTSEIEAYLKLNGMDFQACYITRLIADLKIAGLVDGARGRAGGYTLINRQITGLDVYEAAQGAVVIKEGVTAPIINLIKSDLSNMVLKRAVK